MPQPDDLTPEEQQVRRLLADARHTEPLPTDVAARLDAVLADLRDEDPADPAPGPATRRPIDLAAVRRRRNVRSWLVAAAAVVVVGIGINQLDLSGMSSNLNAGGDGDASSADGGSADRPEAASKPSDSGGGRTTSSATPGENAAPEPEYDDQGFRRPVRLSSDSFGTQVTRLQTRRDLRRLTSSAYSVASAPAVADQLDSSTLRATCRTRAWGRGVAVPARYDGAPGVLVFRRAQGDTQIVDLFLCGADDPERSITLPAP